MAHFQNEYSLRFIFINKLEVKQSINKYSTKYSNQLNY